MSNNATNAGSANAANDTTQWSCEACGCRTNSATANADSCAACGTSRRGIGSAVIRRRPPLPPPSQIRRRVIPRDRALAMMNFEHHPSIGTDDEEEDADEGDILAHHHHHLQRHHHPHDTDDDEDDDASSLLVDQEILESVFLGVAGGGGGGVDHHGSSSSTRAAIEALNAVVSPPHHDHHLPHHQPNHHHHNQHMNDIRLNRITAIAAGRQFDPIIPTSLQPPQPPPPPHLRYVPRPQPPSDPTMDNHDFLRDVRRATITGSSGGGPPPPPPSTLIDPVTLYAMASSAEGSPYNPVWSRKETMGFVPIGGGGREHIRPHVGGGPSRRHLDNSGRRGGNIPTEISIEEGFPNVAFVYQRGNGRTGYGAEGRCAVAQPPFLMREVTYPPPPDSAHRREDEYQEKGGAGPACPFSSLLSTVRRRVFGFRVAFDHPDKETGEGMRGYHLMVGIANSSHLMWGLEDGGRTFERVTNLPGGGGVGSSMRRMENLAHCEYYRSRISGMEASRRGGRGGRGGRSIRGGRGGGLHPSSLPPHLSAGTSAGDSNTTNTLSSFPETNTETVTTPPPHPPFGFKCRDVITVVVDLDSRTLTYWKNEIMLGTLVRNIPSSGSCFPIAGPLESGVSVAVTGMAGDPLAILSSFKEAQIKRREEQRHQRKLTLSRQRGILIKNDGPSVPSQELIHALTNIFSWYIPKGAVNTFDTTNATEEMKLNPVQAARLWYRCGLKLSHLETLLDKPRVSSPATATTPEGEGGGEEKMNDILQQPHITLCDFLDLIARIIAQDEGMPELRESDDNDRENKNGKVEGMRLMGDSRNFNNSSNASRQSSNSADGELHFQAGDYVEILGDSSSGPLSPGDVGVVVETTNRSKGKTHLIRVMCNGRRWWYHPQALIPERIGLVNSATVQFLLKILRSHGYDKNIQPLWGKSLTGDSWQEGDLVICSRSGKVCEKSTVGRIVEGVQNQPSSSSSSSVPEKSRLRASGMVLVECPNHLFGRSVSMLNNVGSVGPSSMALTRRIPVKNLRHTTFYHGLLIDDTSLKIGDNSSIPKGSFCIQNADNDNLEEKVNNNKGSLFQCNDILRSSVDDVKRLDMAAMEAFEKECKRNPASLPGLFGIGLPEAILSAIDYTADKMIRSIKCEKNIPKIEGSSITALGSLARCVCQHLFSCDLASNLASGQMKEQIKEQMRVEASPVLSDTMNPFFPTIDDTDVIAFGGSEVLQPESLHHNNQQPLLGDDHQSLSVEYNNRTRAFLAMLSGSQDSRNSIGNVLSSNIQFNNRSRLSSDGPNEDEMQDLASSHFGSGDFQMSRAAISRRDSQQSNFLGRQYAPNLDMSVNNRSPGRAYDAFLQIGSPQQNDNATASWPELSLQERNNLDHTQGGNAVNLESSIGIKKISILQTLLRGSGVGSSAKVHGSSPSKTRHVNVIAKSVINNGILTGDLQWVKRSFGLQEYKSSTITNKAGGNILCDEDGWPALLLAVSFGCSRMMLKVLMEAGCQVTDSVIRKAAITNRTRSLAYLLRHTFYNTGTVDLSLCSDNVKDIIQVAIERQQEEEAKMRKEAGYFASCLLRKLLKLGLTIRLHSRQQGVSSYFHDCSRAITDLLISNVLFCALHSNQEEAQVILSSDKGSKNKLSHEKSQLSSQALKQHLPDGLLHILPPDIIASALSTYSDTIDNPHTTDLAQEKNTNSRSTAVIYLQFTESYLWSRGISDIAIGLSLARHFLAAKPSCYGDHIERYGIKELAISHASLAKESLAQLETSNIASKNRENRPKSTPSYVVYCPKGHIANLHLTRHSDFRCNLCAKGVEKGHLMYGCRTCDWDACQNCMDQCEGGHVKWKLVQRLALGCQQLISDFRDDNLRLSTTPTDVNRSNSESHVEKSLNSRNDEIQRISRGIRRLQTDSLKQLSGLLYDHDRLTIFEFRNVLLPSLHSAIMGSACPTSGIIPEDEVKSDSYRRCKKPRLGGLSTTLFNVKEREKFIRALIIALILDPIRSDSKVHNLESTPVNSISSQNSASTIEVDTEVVRMEIADNEEEEEEDGDVGESEEQRKNKNGLLSRTPLLVVPPILQYLHTILLFYERATHVGTRDVGRAVCPISHRGGELHSLMIPFDVDLQPSPSRHKEQIPQVGVTHMKVESNTDYAIIHVEPLVSFSDVQMHILRTRPIKLASYSQFCRRLVIDQAVIAESSSPTDRKGLGESLGSFLRIARILDFDERTGAHLVKFASELISKERMRLHSCNIQGFLNQVDFNDDQLLVILAARNYRILHREESDNNQVNSQMDMDSSRLLASSNNLKSMDGDKSAFMLMVGTLVDCKLDLHNDCWQPCTVKEGAMIPSRRHANIIEKWPDDYRPSYTLISNSGVIFSRVTSDKIRDHQSLLDSQHHEKESWNSSTNMDTQRMLLGEIDERFSRHSRTNQTKPVFSERAVLKRAWSALSLTQNLKPHDIDCPTNSNHTARPRKRLHDGNFTRRRCEAEYEHHLSVFEKPPEITVNFSLHESIPCVPMNNVCEFTFFSALRHLLMREKSSARQSLDHGRKCRLFYSFSCSNLRVKVSPNNTVNECLPATFSPPWTKGSLSWDETLSVPDVMSSIFERGDASGNRSITKVSTAPNNSNVLCLALDDSCLQTINLLCTMADRLNRATETDLVPLNKGNSFATTSISQLLKMFESESLSKKLSDQLEGPMAVVAGALPEWCTVMPMYAPVLFSHISRRLFLNRYAFGVSRSLLRQQEAKVAVAHLRQRMSALRGRAVELVGEAFSGGASDPMALQLQADELYGMEEALKSRVTAAFRAQKWRERSLESVKAVVCRDSLLSDAAFVMDKYSTASCLRKRRLEVRFEGESGFDAASGDEAGVTRGFYADVAEALLSCDHVAGIHLISTFPKEECTPKSYLHGEQIFSGSKRTKVPLWIPDVDPSNSTIIPSPRADRSTTLGVFPRPISHKHPQRKCVMEKFKLMGHLFAAAMRDGFTFPLPLSASFLKLVQGSDSSKQQNNIADPIFTANNSSSMSSVSNMSDPFPLPSSMTQGGNMPVDSSNTCDSVDSGNNLSDIRANFSYPFEEYIGLEDKISSRGTSGECNKVAGKFNVNCGLDRFHLSSGDLPRPGFLGGEVFAVEEHICKALDQLDSMEHMLSRNEFLRRKKELASDRSFAKKALGKSFECSFEEYFEDKTFVDPLDPTQGEEAVPLCPHGHLCPVTIENIREWVVLAKQFILFDGVVAQAIAFRQGVDNFFPIGVLRLFTAEELQRDVCGGGDEVNKWNEEKIRSLLKLDGGKGATEALIAVAAMGGEGGAVLSRRFGPSSPTISYLIKTLLEANEFRRRQFLSFVTSVPIVTPGQIEVVPVVTPSGDFLPMSDPGCLPRANTCGRKLYLPKFNSYESFSEVLWAVVTAECRFKGFFEWRG